MHGNSGRVTHQENFFWQATGETRFDDYNRHASIVWTVQM